ncbi:SulP family inorganic anion transporter [Prodigiosinella confusarubida]|uniref:SulP family inorganic anion transporter n=1 Tax=Serratia sp. (strain ATCC 39006) TaxID=104623 RepID=A0A2I5T9N8_SERS3|nr:SulP family inorganic anion transporter [Serratia sp. ATCC 39006]AUH01285.1 SulP family inorganic anion transporter [Serratia sp. ATCC 39006]AUH05606.1 SulP family inorganic anion transporter [Serratia sp. ATCC 39006]
MLLSSNRQDWLGNIRGDILAGIVVALALIPESIAFSIIAGVDPKIGLYAAFCITIVIAFIGGRPGMISSATGAMALLMVTLVKEHGLEYLFAATLLAGMLQVLAGYLKLGSLMRFVSHSVIVGFVNALAILIFMAQLPELTHVGWPVYAMTALGLAIIYLFPFITRSIPSPLVCIIVLTILSLSLGLDIRTVGDMGQLPDTLPVFALPDIPVNLHTLAVIFPYSAGLAAVGLLESMMTSTIVDEMTDTSSDKNRECKAQGIANMVTSLMGGMAGCAMIGQSVINIKSGGRGRLSTLTAGVFLLCLVMFLRDWVSHIPMAALVAVMIMVSISTFSWRSIRDLRTHPVSTSVVMLTTVTVVVTTHNLAYGVLVGVLIAGINFANKVAQFMLVDSVVSENTRHYQVKGQLFFASAERFANSFDFNDSINHIVIDLHHAHCWDITSVSALDKVVMKFRRLGKQVDVTGLNTASATIVDKFAIHDKPIDATKLLEEH